MTGLVGALPFVLLLSVTSSCSTWTRIDVVDLSERGGIAHLDDRPDVPAPLRWFQNEGHWSDPADVHREMAEAGYRRTPQHDFLPMQSFQVFEPLDAAIVAPR